MDSTQRAGSVVAVAVIVVVTVTMTLTVARHTGGGSASSATTTTSSEGFGDESTTTAGPTGEFIRRPVQLDPDTDLRDGDTVDVTSTGFDPDETVTVELCHTPAPGDRLPESECDASTSSLDSSDSAGAVDEQFEVKAKANTNSLGAIDCRQGRGACSIAVRSFENGDRVGWAPVSFDESVLPPPAARITVTPATALVDGTTVTVTGRNSTRKQAVEIEQCPAASDAGQCWTVSGPSPAVANDGTFTLQVPVWRLLDGDPGRPVDCAKAAGTCVLEASGSEQSVPVPLAFDPSGPMPARPALTVTPKDGLTDGDVVTVAGTGFIPTLGVLLEQCARNASGSNSCFVYFDGGPDQPQATAGASGTFTATLQVRRHLEVDGHDVDCAKPGACSVLAVPYSYGDDIIQHASLTPAPVLIQFTG